MYLNIKENKLLSWCEHPYMDYEFVDIDYAIFDINKYAVVDGVLTDISQTPEYMAEQLKLNAEAIYKKILDKYNQALNIGVFQIDANYYGNMAWYDTWSKAVSLYESGAILSDTFTVRLYKKIDGVYYNYNTVQTLPTFKQMLQSLNGQQFLKYQPIRNNLVSQLKLATSIGIIKDIDELIPSAFGDIIDEANTIVLSGV